MLVEKADNPKEDYWIHTQPGPEHPNYPPVTGAGVTYMLLVRFPEEPEPGAGRYRMLTRRGTWEEIMGDTEYQWSRFSERYDPILMKDPEWLNGAYILCRVFADDGKSNGK